MSDIFKRIRHYRKKLGLTQIHVAEKLGIRVDNYSKYESGARVPRADRLVKLAKILGVSYNALYEGVEREFAALLSRHAVGIIVGDSGSFSAFPNDMETSYEAYPVIAECMDSGLHRFAGENPEFCEKYLSDPSLADLIALYEMYREQCDPNPPESSITITYRYLPAALTLEPATAYKWAFCIAMKRYMDDTYGMSVIDEAEEIMGGASEHIDPLQFFAVKVFVPYLSFLIGAVELCINTTIDDFEISFLFDALTPPDEDDEPDDENDDDD